MNRTDRDKCYPEKVDHYKKYDRDYQIEQRKKVCEYKNGVKVWGCFICGYKKCAKAIEFHHVKEKIKDISLIKSRIRLMEKEIRKCLPICANCHREVHDKIIPINMINYKYLKFLEKLDKSDFSKLPLFSKGFYD